MSGCSAATFLLISKYSKLCFQLLNSNVWVADSVPVGLRSPPLMPGCSAATFLLISKICFKLLNSIVWAADPFAGRLRVSTVDAWLLGSNLLADQQDML